MSNNRFNCYLHDHKLVDTPPPSSQPDYSQKNTDFPKTVSSHRWNNDLSITFTSYFSLDGWSNGIFCDPSSPWALLFTYMVSFLTEELLTNDFLSITIKLSYLHCLHSIYNSLPPSLAVYSIVNNFLKSYSTTDIDSSLLT
ncbi:hypothetical protein C1645_835944 [Glomus cerebriforme]|uniref:Uncharacterized protein n=1 Tax=Glomus cerebriforme TaxID=658196 RepID=A0A397SCQ1_9GLOM|nr:hypothetical protein C1645_835944 [Glomus cerebriforme]